MKNKFWIVNKINPTTAQILIYGVIGWEVESADFVIELSTLASQFRTIQIRINSAGGSVFEGIAIRSAIKTFQKAGITIDCYVDGIAASMAAPIAVSGNKVYISKFGRMMLHKAKGYGEGNSDDLRRTADLIDTCENDVIQMIAERTGMSAEDVKAKFFKPGVDLWLSAQECIDMKLADEIFDAEEVPVPQNVTGAKDLVNIFDTVLNKTTIIKNSYKMKKDLLQKLGLPETATDEQIDAAVEKSLNDKTAVENKLATAENGTIEAMVDQAITDKKLVAADKADWVKNFKGNVEGLKLALSKLPGAVKPTQVINQQTPDVTSDEGKQGNDDEQEWDAVVKKGGMKAIEEIRNSKPDVYASMYRKKYNRDPQMMGMAK
jgi:ATP-dependent Clp protease protease subunit